MIEKGSDQEVFSRRHTITVYTPEVIKNLQYDSDLQDGLGLLRQGIHELRDINGVGSVQEWQADYTLSTENAPDTTKIALWEQVKNQGREPFLLIDHNTKDGIIGALKGRTYTYGGTGESALFINWVVVRDSGSNNEDAYSWRGKDTAGQMYKKVEELAREKNVTLLIAGINPNNPRSVAFHEKQGFISESFDEKLSPNGSIKPYATEHGAFIPPYPVKDVDSEGTPITGEITFYTKRLQPTL